MTFPTAIAATDVKAFENSPVACIIGIFQNDLFARVDFFSAVEVRSINQVETDCGALIEINRFGCC